MIRRRLIDNQGFRYRGHQFTDADGRYRLETIVPARGQGTFDFLVAA